ncbi:hypothetical protein FKM82_029554 [Ascaphus truei]
MQAEGGQHTPGVPQCALSLDGLNSEHPLQGFHGSRVIGLRSPNIQPSSSVSPQHPAFLLCIPASLLLPFADPTLYCQAAEGKG